MLALSESRKKALSSSHQVQKFIRYITCHHISYTDSSVSLFNRDADETKSWISEKDVVLSLDDYGRDLVSVQALQRKHEGLERDLAALEDKVNDQKIWCFN